MTTTKSKRRNKKGYEECRGKEEEKERNDVYELMALTRCFPTRPPSVVM